MIERLVRPVSSPSSLAVSASQPAPHLTPTVPGWVDALIAGSRAGTAAGLPIRQTDTFALVMDTIRAAAAMDATALRQAVSSAYRNIGEALASMHRAPVRFWNYLPDPSVAMGGGLDRYMVFNAGRYQGYRVWSSGPDEGRSLATASAVGIVGDDLVIHCLAARQPGRAIENPRQRPAWRYSARYGPTPPSFARATVVDVNGAMRLLIGGTASIVGEDSLHPGDAAAQTRETLSNLTALIDNAAPDACAEPALERLRTLRAYVKHHEDVDTVRRLLAQHCPRIAAKAEVVIARICRPELLVEIEGVADLASAGERHTA